MISYIVGRNLGHLSSCIAVLDRLKKETKEKTYLMAYKTSHRWINSNINRKQAEVHSFSRSELKSKVDKLLQESSVIFHDWREEVENIKEAQQKHSPIIAGMYHSELKISHDDNMETIKCKMQVQEIANRTTNVFFFI